MAMRFNPAPGWPAAPAGFVPPAGWRPNPSWPPAPPDWQFWVDDVAPPVPATPPASSPPVETSVERAVAKPSWRERREAKRAERKHAQALAEWTAEGELLDEVAGVARAAANGQSSVDGLLGKPGEISLWAAAASLIEPRRSPGHYQGGFSSVSFRIAKGVRYTVGGTRGHYVPGPEVQQPVDRGRVFVTSQRMVFLGGRNTREWAFGKLLGVDASVDGTVVLLHVSNRQKVSGVGVAELDVGRLQSFLALGAAISQHGAADVAAECERAAAAHRAERP